MEVDEVDYAVHGALFGIVFVFVFVFVFVLRVLDDFMSVA